MSNPTDDRLATRPVVCFGLVIVTGVLGFVLAGNGFARLGFLLLYIPAALIVSAFGVAYSIKAYAGLPRGHWGRTSLTVLIALMLVGLVLAFVILIAFNSHPAGGF
jgi:hypothetical protein